MTATHELADAVVERRTRVVETVAELGLARLLVSRPSNIRYLTGFSGSAGYLLLAADGKPTLVVDVRYRDQAEQQSGGVEVLGDAAPPNLWPALLAVLEGLHGDCGLEGSHLAAAQYVELQQRGVQAVLTSNLIERQRELKDEIELGCLRRAGEIADGLFEHLVGTLRPGMTERAVAGEIELHQRRLGASGSATEVIVASGPRSALPHGRASERALAAGEPVMVDLSPTVDGYRADATRTFHLGEPSSEFERIYAIVAEAQGKAQDAAVAGASCSAVDAVARTIIDDAGYGSYFQHSLGHGVGLDVHEGPRLSPHDASEVRAGMVLTIEPGIYVPGLGGVRIENSIAVHESEIESLNRFPTELITIPVG